MTIAQVVAGAYTSSYNGIPLTGNSLNLGAEQGFMDDNGYEIEQQTHGEMVDRTDLYGQSLLDWVHQGGSVFCTFTCMTFQNSNTAIKNVFYPWSGAGGLGIMASPTLAIGRLASRVAQALILTAVANTPASTIPPAAVGGLAVGSPPGIAPGPITLSAYLAILPPGSNLRLMYATRVRKVPCRLAFLPYDVYSSGAFATYWWQET